MDVRLRREGISIPLAFAAVAIVVVAASGNLPNRWVPDAPDALISAIPHVNVFISVAAVVTIVYGWYAIRRGAIQRHRRAMLLATTLFTTFLVLYLYRLAVLGGPTGFEGSSFVYRYLYLPILGLHIGLAIVCIPLLFDAIALAVTVPVNTLPTTRHPRVGRVAAALWTVSFVLGIVVYLLLYWV